MPDDTTTIAMLKEAVREFAQARDWEPYHTPKNLAMALAVEAAELMEPFRWLECAESQQIAADAVQRRAIADEMADVAILLLNFSVSTGIDLSDAIQDKMIRNAERYPAPSR